MNRFLRNAGAGTAVAIAVGGVGVFWALLHGSPAVKMAAAVLMALLALTLGTFLLYGIWLGGMHHSPLLAKNRWLWASFLGITAASLLYFRAF